MVSTPASIARSNVDLGADPARARKERRFGGVLLVATVISLTVLAVLLFDIAADGLGRLNLDFITSYQSRFADRTGIRAGIWGTFSLMVIVGAVAFPVGVGAAIYLEEFAPKNRFTNLLETNISNLAGVPSVVYGLLGLGVFAFILGLGRSLLVGGLTLALLILPVIIVASREALRAVPQSIRQAGLALGATPLQVAFKQTVPAALPGVMTGTILALSRAIGETAPLLVVGAALIRNDVKPWDFDSSFTAMPVQVFQYVGFPNREFQIEATAAGIIVLMVMLLTMNSIAILVRNRFETDFA